MPGPLQTEARGDAPLCELSAGAPRVEPGLSGQVASGRARQGKAGSMGKGPATQNLDASASRYVCVGVAVHDDSFAAARSRRIPPSLQPGRPVCPGSSASSSSPDGTSPSLRRAVFPCLGATSSCRGRISRCPPASVAASPLPLTSAASKCLRHDGGGDEGLCERAHFECGQNLPGGFGSQDRLGGIRETGGLTRDKPGSQHARESGADEHASTTGPSAASVSLTGPRAAPVSLTVPRSKPGESQQEAFAIAGSQGPVATRPTTPGVPGARRDSNTLRFCQWNCCGLRAHYATLLEACKTDSIDIFLLQETLLPEEISITLPLYNAYHLPFVQQESRGLTIFARKELRCTVLDPPLVCGEGVERQALRIDALGGSIVVYNIYRPQQAALDVNAVFGLASYENLLVAGDFNCHHPWLGSHRTANNAGRALFASFEDSGHVSWLNDTSCPTHQHQGRLDLAFISSPLARSSSWRLHPTLSSDHFGIFIDVAVSRIPPPPTPRRFLMGQADWGRFKDRADILFEETDFCLPLDERAELVSSTILNAARLAIPTSTRVYRRAYRDAWIYTPRVRELNNRLSAARNLFRRHPSAISPRYLQSVARHANEEKTKLREQAWQSWCHSLGPHTPIGDMWRTVKSIYHGRPPALPHHPHPQAEAENLANNFAVRTSPALLPVRTRDLQERLSGDRHERVTLACGEDAATDAPFTLGELDNAFPRKQDTAPGADEITYSMISHLGRAARSVLLGLYNKSLAEGSPPAAWKTATIIPIPKPNDPGATRPISLLSCVGKIMERMVLARLQWQVGPLHPHLFAFQRHRSTTTCLLTLLGKLHSRSGLVVFLDLGKAFELASPLAILDTLATKGIKGKLLCWLREYLRERTARVKFQEHFSRIHSHQLGTPQGGCLSPYLFNILVENLLHADYAPGSLLLVYADDLALYLPKRNVARTAPLALRTLHHQCESLGLKINPRKTKYMTFGMPPLSQPLLLGGEPLSHVTAHKYLGIFLDRGLTFKQHINYISDRTAARINVLRYISGRGLGASPSVLRTFYVAAIRSIIDYAAPCLPGLYASHVHHLEVLQNKAMRTILRAPPWTAIVTLREECRIPSIQHRIFARTCVAFTQHVRRWPNSSLSRSFLHAFQRPLADRPDGDILHAAVDAARRLGVDASVRSEPDLALPDYMPPPPWSPPLFEVITSPHARPRALHPRQLHQEALEGIHDCLSPTALLYYTDGSVGERGAAGAAIIHGNVTISHRLPTHATSFQAELVAILLALRHASDAAATGVYTHTHIFTDSLTSLQSLRAPFSNDNHQLISSVLMQIQLLFQYGITVVCHWVPGHIDVRGNEQADAAARVASTRAFVTFPVVRSMTSITTEINTAALSCTRRYFDEKLAEETSSTTWYLNATDRLPLPSLDLPPGVAYAITRLRLGYACRSEVITRELYECPFCYSYDRHPLLHYLLHCPTTQALRGGRHTHGDNHVNAAANVVLHTPFEVLVRVCQDCPPPR